MGDMENVWVLKDKKSGVMIRVKAVQQDEQNITMYVSGLEGSWPSVGLSFDGGVITAFADIGNDRVQLQRQIYHLGEKDVQ